MSLAARDLPPNGQQRLVDLVAAALQPGSSVDISQVVEIRNRLEEGSTEEVSATVAVIVAALHGQWQFRHTLQALTIANEIACNREALSAFVAEPDLRNILCELSVVKKSGLGQATDASIRILAAELVHTCFGVEIFDSQVNGVDCRELNRYWALHAQMVWSSLMGNVRAVAWTAPNIAESCLGTFSALEASLNVGAHLRVVSPAILRREQSVQSRVIAEVAAGTPMQLVEIGKGRRIRVVIAGKHLGYDYTDDGFPSPLAIGWISFKTEADEPLVELQVTDVQDGEGESHCSGSDIDIDEARRGCEKKLSKRTVASDDGLTSEEDEENEKEKARKKLFPCATAPTRSPPPYIGALSLE